MEIILYRKRTNELYTEGQIFINDDFQTCTVEATDIMLPADRYILRIVKKSERKQSLVIFRYDGTSTGWRLDMGASFIDSRKELTIAIGRPLIPGTVYKSTKDYERLTDRFSKCTARGEQMYLIITDRGCKPCQIIKHWVTDYAADKEPVELTPIPLPQ